MSMFEQEKRGRYISVLSDGKFHEEVAQGTEDAVLREYETSDGKKGSKWEMVYSKINAKISNIGFRDGDYGEQILIDLVGDEGEAQLQMGVSTPFAESFMKSLPNVKLDQEVTLSPYAFNSDKDPDKKIRGLTIFQNGFKVENFFYDGKENKNNYPNPPKEKEEMTKKDWKRYFEDANDFVVTYTKEHILPQFSQDPVEHLGRAAAPKEDINPEDIPF